MRLLPQLGGLLRLLGERREEPGLGGGVGGELGVAGRTKRTTIENLVGGGRVGA